MNSVFIRYEKKSADLQKMRRGVLVASDTGKTAAYGLVVAQDKGPVFVGPQVPVYEGMIVGINGRDDDLEINVCKEKQLTNNRSVGEDAVILTPPIYFSLEQYIGFLEDDELLEITPKNLRLRKKILNKDERYKARKRS
jgi:GTP-binding protein